MIKTFYYKRKKIDSQVKTSSLIFIIRLSFKKIEI